MGVIKDFLLFSFGLPDPINDSAIFCLICRLSIIKKTKQNTRVVGGIIDPKGSNVANTIARVLQPWCIKTQKPDQAYMRVEFLLFLPTMQL